MDTDGVSTDDDNYEDVEEPNGDTTTDRWAVYKSLITSFWFLAIATNVALLALVIARVYHYRWTDKWKWARLHFLGGISIVHILLLALALITASPEVIRWVARSDGRCQFVMTALQSLQMLVWLYLIAIAITTFFHIFHPPALIGNRSFVASLVVHAVLWAVAFVSVETITAPFIHSATNSAYHEGKKRFCTVSDSEIRDILLLTMTLMLSFVILFYLAVVSLIGLCLVYPSTGTTGEDDGLLQWIINSRLKAGLFLALMTGLVGATFLPWTVVFVSRYIHGTVFEVQTDAEIQRYYTILVLKHAYFPLFPLCCLALEEMGVNSLINRIRKFGLLFRLRR